MNELMDTSLMSNMRQRAHEGEEDVVEQLNEHEIETQQIRKNIPKQERNNITLTNGNVIQHKGRK